MKTVDDAPAAVCLLRSEALYPARHPASTSNHSSPSRYIRMATIDTGGSGVSAGAPEPAPTSLPSAADPHAHTDGANGHNHDIEGLPSEAFSASAPRARRPSRLEASITPDAAHQVNQMLAEGASAKNNTSVENGPDSSFWCTRRLGHTGADDDEEETLTNLQAEAFSYVMFHDAENTGDTCTTAKTAMASSAFELVSSMKQLQTDEGAGHPKAVRPLSLLGSVSKALPNYLPVVSSITGGHKQQNSTSSGSSSVGARIQSVTTVLEDEA